MLAALVVFLATYAVLAIGRLPGLQLDRTGAAIVGASLMVGLGALSLQEAFQAIDYETIILLFGMMILVAHLRLSGFFTAVSGWVVARARHPLLLLCALVLISGLFSAFFVNDTMCLVLTPLVLEIVGQLGYNPVPYLLATAAAANIGSAATITGNPQNMLIGVASRIPYRTFVARLAPAAAAGLALTVLVIFLRYRRELTRPAAAALPERRVRVHRALLWKSVAAAAGMVALFFAGWPVPKVALVISALLLVTRRVKPEKIYREIDWALLVMFAGLFIVIAGVEKTSLSSDLALLAARLQLDRPAVLSVLAVALSNLVSNVPAVLLFKPLLAHVSHPAQAWLTLALSSTLAGNLTLPGSVANLIVVERARRSVRISFAEHLKVGVPLTILSLGIGLLLLR